MKTLVVDAKKALEIVRPIPAEDFTSGSYKHENKSCVLGWVHRIAGGDEEGHGDENGYGLRQASIKFLREVHGISDDISGVNNQPDVNGYKEPVIKDRVIHFLEDMEKAGF